MKIVALLFMFKILFLTVLSASTAFANYSINFDVGYAFTSTNSFVPAGSLGVVVVDKNSDGFSQGSNLMGKTLSLGSSFGIDDEIIAILSASDTVGAGHGLSYTGAAANLTNPAGSIAGVVNIGDSIAIYFFPSITSSATILDGTSYGFFAGIGDGVAISSLSTTNWKIPTDGSFDLNVYTPTLMADYETAHNPLVDPSNANLTANFTVPVPEPSTYALMGLGLVVIGFIARRKTA